MQMKKYLTLIVLLLFTISIISAQSPADTIIKKDFHSLKIERDLDSLLTMWYVKKSLEANNDKLITSDTLIRNLSDSVYISRLNALPTLITLTYNEKIRKYIEAYLRMGKSQVPVMLGLSDYYFPIFEETLDKYDLPIELKYLPIIESALNPNAVSRAGATGLWQFMYSTGKMYKLEINTFVDNRRDPIKSSQAAAKLLRDLYKIYQDWTLVIAAYNCGPGNVNKAIRRAKGKRSYWEIYNYLPRETRGYVPAFIAATYVMHYHKEHNIRKVKIDLPNLTDTIMINKKLHLMQVSKVLNIPFAQLRDMNPQYKKDVVPAINDIYTLKLPFEYATKFIELEDSIYAYKDSIFFNPRRIVITPSRRKKSKYYSSKSYSKNSKRGKSKTYYRVRTGDNIGSIAKRYSVRVSDIKSWNRIRGHMIHTGQKLIVYAPKSYKTTAKKNRSIQRTTNKSVISYKTQAFGGSYVYYKIKVGENLWVIAKRYPGISNYDIMRINNFTNRDVRNLKAGQIIKIKKKS